MKLGTLRNYREQVEEALRVELAAVEQALSSALEHLRRLEAETETSAKLYVTDVRTGLMADEVVQRYADLETLTLAVRKAQEAVEEVCRRRDQKMGEVLEASREKKKLELLEQRDDLRAQRELDRREQRASDEVAGRRFLAQRRHDAAPKHK
jgi:flagellar export protein FliJ